MLSDLHFWDLSMSTHQQLSLHRLFIPGQLTLESTKKDRFPKPNTPTFQLHSLKDTPFKGSSGERSYVYTEQIITRLTIGKGSTSETMVLYTPEIRKLGYRQGRFGRNLNQKRERHRRQGDPTSRRGPYLSHP